MTALEIIMRYSLTLLGVILPVCFRVFVVGVNVLFGVHFGILHAFCRLVMYGVLR